MTKIIATTLRLPDNLLSRLKSIAEKKGHTFNSLILHILWEWLKANEK